MVSQEKYLFKLEGLVGFVFKHLGDWKQCYYCLKRQKIRQPGSRPSKMLCPSQKRLQCQQLPGQNVIKQIYLFWNSIWIIVAGNETESQVSEASELERVLWILYSTKFCDFIFNMLINTYSEINAMQQSFVRKHNFSIWKIDINAWKIKDSRLEIYKMIIALFWVDNKDKKLCFFKEIFLLVEIGIDVAFEISFSFGAMLRSISTIISWCKDFILPFISFLSRAK